MAEKKRRRVPKGEERARSGRGVAGLSYYSGGFYLSPAQFGYYTAQSPTGELTTATAGAAGDSGGGDGGGGGTA